MSRIFLSFLVCFSFLLSGCHKDYLSYKPTVEQQKREIRWLPYSNAALMASKAAKKPVLIYFEMEDCASCESMRKNTLSDPEVVKFVADNFVPVLVSSKDAKVISEHSIESFPSILIISSYKELRLGMGEGYTDVDTLMSFLRLLKTFDDALNTSATLNESTESLLNLGN